MGTRVGRPLAACSIRKGGLVGTLEAKDVSVGPAGVHRRCDGHAATSSESHNSGISVQAEPVPGRLRRSSAGRQAGRRADRLKFGIRTRWNGTRTEGFLLNGREVKLKGTCNHQDHAGVGVALPDGLMEWRIQQLLKMGSNAYRTSHNPVAPEFLDACDRLGMLVLDETRHLGDTSSS